MSAVRLRPVAESDVPIFFDQQLDPAAHAMVAFIAREPGDREAFEAHWKRILRDETIVTRAILADGEVAGYVTTFLRNGEREVGYWLGRAFWNRGVATAALSQFLAEVPMRPMLARVAKDNAASLRVVEKCRFVITGEDRGFSKSRGREVEEFVFTLAE